MDGMRNLETAGYLIEYHNPINFSYEQLMNNSLRILFAAIIAVMFSSNLAIANAADDAKSFFSSAEVKFGTNNFKGAVADYTKAIELDPKFADAFNSGAAAKFSLGEKQGAIDDFTKSIAINPTSADTFTNRGSVRSDLGDTQGATSDFTKAIEINPAFVPAYLNRAALRLDSGDKQGATADLLQAAKLGNQDAQLWLKSNGISKW